MRSDFSTVFYPLIITSLYRPQATNTLNAINSNWADVFAQIYVLVGHIKRSNICFLLLSTLYLKIAILAGCNHYKEISHLFFQRFGVLG